MASHNDFGKLAEDLAVDYLIRDQYKILERNYRFQKAEIDIIAEKDGQIIVLEVKARKTNIFIEPQEAVNQYKIKLIIKAANQYLEDNNFDKEVRFDIISILPNNKKALEIFHIKDAFQSFDI